MSDSSGAFLVQSRSLAEVDSDHALCENCHRPVPQRDGERRDKWLKRQTCSKKCRGELMALIVVRRHNKEDIPHPPCPVCHRPIERRAGQTRWHFNRRRTCGEKCFLALQRRNAGGALPSIRDRRKALGMARYDLAVEAGIADKTLALVEAGYARPNAEAKLLAALARIEGAKDEDGPDPGWPKLVEENLPAGCFGAHNLSIPTRDFQHVSRPATHVERQSNS